MADKDFQWPRPLPAPDFVMVPKLVATQIMPRLSGAEFKVFYALLQAAYAWGTGRAELSIKEIVAACGVGRGTAQDAVKELARVGLIAVEPRSSAAHGTEANVYRVLITDDPRYVDRGGHHPVPKTGTASPANRQGRPTLQTSATRGPSSTQRRKQKEDVPHTQEDYARGAYGVCASCKERPCRCA